ncbi:MAG: magnesium/cobalt transporter CorA [Vicinamibacterales bacterium]
MISIIARIDDVTSHADSVDPAWLTPESTVVFWVDMEGADEAARSLLSTTFHFHELAIEDALAELHYPKIEAYDGLLYLILHGIAPGAGDVGFDTQDVDFFVGRNFLVTVHNDRSRSIETERDACLRHTTLLDEGPVSLAYRIIDRLVDHYNPEVDRLEERLEQLEQTVFDHPEVNPLKQMLSLKSDVASLRRVALPQRDAVGRLARREFPQISDALAYKFRDVYDHLVRLTDEAIFLQDRVTGLLDAHLSNQSNRLNQVMKVLTVIATIFMPLTVLSGIFGMNVTLPQLPGGPGAQFWWVMAMMAAISAVMLWGFRRMKWL